MFERKSWASSLEAKQSHAIFECLAHNLLLLFEQFLRESEGLRDELEEKKRLGRSRAAMVASKATDVIRAAGNFINSALQRATQRTQRFIRWVRVWIYKQAPWGDSIHRPPQGSLGRNLFIVFHTDRGFDAGTVLKSKNLFAIFSQPR